MLEFLGSEICVQETLSRVSNNSPESIVYLYSSFETLHSHHYFFSGGATEIEPKT